MTDKLAEELFTFLNDYALLLYEEEKRRSESIIHQASQMQAAFSFISAALFVAGQVLIEHCHLLSNYFYFCSISSIVIMLLFSLITATLAQNRGTAEVLANPYHFHKYIEKEYKLFTTETQRKAYMCDAIEIVQKDLRARNDNAVEYIKISMYLFYLAIALIFIWFFIAIAIIYCGWRV